MLTIIMLFGYLLSINISSFLIFNCLKLNKKQSEDVYLPQVLAKKDMNTNVPKINNEKANITKLEKSKQRNKKKNIFSFFSNVSDKDLKTPKSEFSEVKTTQTTESLIGSEEKDFSNFDSCLDKYVFEEEHLGDIDLIPTPDEKELARLRKKSKKRTIKSPEDFSFHDDEDSLYNIPSLQIDAKTKSAVSLSQLPKNDPLFVNADLDHTFVGNRKIFFQKSHLAYPESKKEKTFEIK